MGEENILPSFSVLRRKAEEILEEKSIIPESLEGLTPVQAMELLQELRIHQVELEMQNEDLRRAHLKLETSRARYYDLYDLAPVGYLTFDVAGQIQEANLTAAHLLQLERGTLIGQPFTRFIVRDDQDIYYLYRKQLLKAGSQQVCELRIGRKGGLPFWGRLEITVVFDAEGQVSGYRAVIIDISERKRSEEVLKKVQLELEQRVKKRTGELEHANKALQESEEHFRQIVEMLPVAVLGQLNQEIVFINTAAIKLLHAENSSFLLGRNILDFLHTKYKELFIQNLHKVMEGKAHSISFPARLSSLKDKIVDVEMHLIPFTYQGHSAVQISAYDITRRKKLEQELQNREKLEAVGNLAGGIAHDFNNYLATLLGNVSLAKAYMDNPEKVFEKLDNMEKVTLRAKDLTDQLSVFAKGGAPIKKKVTIRNLISESVSFALSGSSVQCELVLPGDLFAAEIDEGQITQVLYNIVLNAVQAMPEGGTIRVIGENVSSGGLTGGHVTLPHGEYIKLSLSDEGPGIPENLLERIYEPFFSTKAKGGGLGLATSYHIIKNHQGFIQAESEQGKGTTFIIYLPACSKAALLSEREDDVMLGTGKVLVMDDEADIREAVGEMLTFLGYEPHLAVDGAEAIEMYLRAAAGDRPFDLVVLDLTIPGGMGGNYVIEQLLAVDPSVKGIICSGYSNDPVMANYSSYGFKGVIKKPYDIKEFSKIIHSIKAGA